MGQKNTVGITLPALVGASHMKQYNYLKFANLWQVLQISADTGEESTQVNKYRSLTALLNSFQSQLEQEFQSKYPQKKQVKI